MSDYPRIQNQQTFVFIKPDAVQRSLVGTFIQKFEQAGLKVVASKFMIPEEAKLWTHYNKDDAWYTAKGENMVKNLQEKGLEVTKPAIEYGKDIVRSLIDFMTSGPVMAMVLEGNEAVDTVVKLVGSTEPKSSDVGTIRGDFTSDTYKIANLDNRAVRNLMHCSDTPENAQTEINIWFDKSEIVKYNNVNDIILYDVSWSHVAE
jgi:nucleoside-diphosphate kinase